MSTPKSKFTTEMIARIAELYDHESPEVDRRAAIATLSEEFKLSTRSIIGKISTSPDLFTWTPYSKAAPKARKATNMELVRELATLTNIGVDTLVSLERSSKAAILALIDFSKVDESET